MAGLEQEILKYIADELRKNPHYRVCTDEGGVEIYVDALSYHTPIASIRTVDFFMMTMLKCEPGDISVSVHRKCSGSGRALGSPGMMTLETSTVCVSDPKFINTIKRYIDAAYDGWLK